MEHPVPQNVTSFEFHLVGDMTIRQFGYLATGVVVAYFTYLLLFSLSPVLAIPIIIFSLGAGFSLAFVPILDRPLDHWVRAFFKSVYSPTEGYWLPPGGSKEKINPNDPLFLNRLNIYLTQLATPAPVIPAPTIYSIPAPTSQPTSQPTPLPKPTIPSTPLLPKPVAPPPPPTQPTPPTPHFPTMASSTPIAPKPKLPSSEELTKLVEMARQVQLLREKIAETEKQIEELKLAATSTSTHLYEKQSQQAFESLQTLVKQTEDIYQKNAQISNIPVAPKPIRTVVVPPPKHIDKQILLTSFPNVINGVVTDSSGNYLEGVIVIIHNKDQMPVRALKTNKLGQFSGATPLPSGVYSVTLEKDNLAFDTFQVTLGGEVMPPLRVSGREVSG